MSKPLAKKEGDEFTYKGKNYIVTKITKEQQKKGSRCSKLCDLYNTCIPRHKFVCSNNFIIKLNEEEIW